MGALSALIVGPCVAPPLAAAVLYIGQSQDPVFGGLALFVLAMGMGLPLLAFGAAAGRGMPTSGPWMTGVQRVFGFVFRSEEHTSELQSLMRISYAVFCLKKKKY